MKNGMKLNINFFLVIFLKLPYNKDKKKLIWEYKK